MPPVESYKIIFNERDDAEYWMTLKHTVSETERKVIPHFYPLQIEFEK